MAVNWIAARVVESHSKGRTDSGADGDATTRARRPRANVAATHQADSEFLRARASRLRTSRRATEASRLLEGQALKVAEHHRQPKDSRQALDRAVYRLGLLAVDRPPVGRRGRRGGRDA